MVIGNGMVANRFINYKDDQDIIIFASGVSNSKNTATENFAREFNLLQQTIADNPSKLLVYFSTCSILDNDLTASPYVIHKKKVEEYISLNIPSYLILRISNLAGTSNNPYTLLNNFIFNILANHPLIIWKNAYRNIIGIDDMYSIADYFLKEKLRLNTTINIANPANYTVPFIIQTIENHLNKKVISTEVDKGSEFKIDVSTIEPVIYNLNIRFHDNYLPSLLKQYYHSK